MNLKTFRGSTMAEALTEVKKDLGKEAVILHTRTYKVGGVFGVGGRQVVEITASDTMQTTGRPSRRPESAGPANGRSNPQPRVSEPATGRSLMTARPGSAAGVDRPESPLVEVLPTRTGASRAQPGAGSGGVTAGLPSGGVPSNPGRGIDRLTSRADFGPESARATDELRAELASIRSLVTHLVRASPARNESSALGVLPDALFDAHARLTEAGVRSEVASSIIAPLRNACTPLELSDPSCVRALVLGRLAAMIKVAKSPQPGSGGRPHTVALIGPTGVGKTTTIAKLAALQRLRHGRRVGLVTSDTYRIAAVDQLRTYANIIGLPVRVASSATEMERACASLADCDMIFVDTAGRSPQDAARLDELRDMLAACRPTETHLVLSMAAAEAVLTRTVERFQPLLPDRLILTKLDEAVTFGCIANLAGQTSLPISFVTDGQEVPDQIEEADSARLATLVFGKDAAA